MNKDLSEVIASLGHTDTLVVCDAGFPIPTGVRRIDLAVRQGLPAFKETTQAIADDLKVDSIIVAEETARVSPMILEGLKAVFKDVQITTVCHAELKKLSHEAKAVVRTGEFTPYANVILVCGIVF